SEQSAVEESIVPAPGLSRIGEREQTPFGVCDEYRTVTGGHVPRFGKDRVVLGAAANPQRLGRDAEGAGSCGGLDSWIRSGRFEILGAGDHEQEGGEPDDVSECWHGFVLEKDYILVAA